MPDEEREATVYNLISKLKSAPVPKTEIEKTGFEDWSPNETAQLLSSLLSAEMVVEDEKGNLSPGKKGLFFFKRVRRKRQGFV